MTEIVLSSRFRKAFKRKVRGNKILETRFRDRAAIFENSPFDPRLKTHKLSGELDDLWSFSVDYDVRVIFSFMEADKALFLDIGSHEEVY
jgi:mRNA-degrading endonuclease YafQ of YafQ-DinJ toxin-antitoxin module